MLQKKKYSAVLRVSLVARISDTQLEPVAEPTRRDRAYQRVVPLLRTSTKAQTRRNRRRCTERPTASLPMFDGTGHNIKLAKLGRNWHHCRVDSRPPLRYCITDIKPPLGILEERLDHINYYNWPSLLRSDRLSASGRASRSTQSEERPQLRH